MLPKLDENTAILLQDFQRPICASLMTSLQTLVLLFFMLVPQLLVLVQCNSVTMKLLDQVAFSILDVSLEYGRTYSLMQSANVPATLPVLSTAL
jgi:hypothetical protein